MPPQVSEESRPLSCPLAVLDTNVVLSLFWFKDPTLAHLLTALESGALAWRASPPMRQELDHVLARAQLPVGCADRTAVLEAFDRLARVVPAIGSLSTPRCTDPDDQMFIDLALGIKAAWLLTRDRAVLKLRRKLLSKGGCQVRRPEDWRPVTADAHDPHPEWRMLTPSSIDAVSTKT